MSALSIPARSIGSTAAALLAPLPGGGRRTGTVAAVFSRSCYLDISGNMIALVAPEVMNGPLNVVLERGGEDLFTHMRKDAAVEMSTQALAIHEGLNVDISTAATWNALLPTLTPAGRAGLPSDLDVIKSVLSGAPAESLAHPPARSSRAGEGMDALYSGLRSGDAPAVAHGASRLAGLGAGLTPSGDDVLTGALVALRLCSRRPPGPVRDAVVETCRGRTTRISLAYLEAAARGEAGEAWHLLAQAFGGGHAAVAEAARRVMRFGETSGADMLTGFVLAAEALGDG